MRQGLKPLLRETVAGLLVLAIVALLALLLSGHSHSVHVPSPPSKPSAAVAERVRVQQAVEKRKREAEAAEERKREAEAGGWLSTISNPNSNNINEVNSHPVTVDGQTYAHTVQLVDLNSKCASITDPSTVSFTVPPGATHLSGEFGWASDSNGSSAELFVYADSTSNKPLWGQPFSNPGLPLMFKQFNKLAGAHSIIFELVGQQCDNGTFVLAEARFTA
jgi:hypothetical protein